MCMHACTFVYCKVSIRICSASVQGGQVKSYEVASDRYITHHLPCILVEYEMFLLHV